MKETITYLLETKLHKNPNVDSEKLLRPLDNFNSRPFSKKCLSKHLTSLHFTLPSLVKKNRLVKRNNFTVQPVRGGSDLPNMQTGNRNHNSRYHKLPSI